MSILSKRPNSWGFHEGKHEVAGKAYNVSIKNSGGNGWMAYANYFPVGVRYESQASAEKAAIDFLERQYASTSASS